MNRLIGIAAALFSALALCVMPIVPAFAAPLPYINAPMDTPQGLVNSAIANINAGAPGFSTIVACSGTTTATCQGLRLNVSITGLTTADAGAVSAAMTVTDASVTAASQVICQVVGYAGTGVPYDAVVIPAAGSFSFVIQNNSASASLNATVVSACLVYN